MGEPEEAEQTRSVEFEKSMLARLDQIVDRLDTLSTQLCPVCGPQLTQEKHPTEVVKNGKSH